MPILGQLDCSIRVANRIRLHEYGTKYDKHAVQTYVAIPDVPTAFSITLRAAEYISPGLAAFIFIDGVYQCNKAKGGFDPKTNPKAEFNFYSKDETIGKGRFISRDWRFEKLQISEFCVSVG
jgi:hypothetical protein